LALQGLRLFVPVALLLGLLACKGNREKNRSPQKGSPAFGFSIQDTKGRTWTLESVKGQVVLLRFWADWCSSCRFEMPVIEKYYRIYHSRGFQVLAVNVNQSSQVAEVFATQMNMSMPVLLDIKGKLTRQYGVHAIPTNFLIDRQGVLRETLIGEVFREEKSLRELLQKYFPENQASP
jgi:cytochrome c biogenesis protein CcmG/thiol:disulfide interchange protein DsbE